MSSAIEQGLTRNDKRMDVADDGLRSAVGLGALGLAGCAKSRTPVKTKVVVLPA
jgi:hypothetical protein